MLKSSPNEITDSDNSVLLIPEIGLAHYGNLQLALNYVDLVSSLGLKTVKFQHHLSLYESSPSEQFRVKHRHFPYSSRFEYWDKMSLSESEWIYLYKYVLSKDLSFSIKINFLGLFNKISSVKLPVPGPISIILLSFIFVNFVIFLQIFLSIKKF